LTNTTDLLQGAEPVDAAPTAAPRTRRRATSGGGLSAMVLPELQALAGGLGIVGTARMRKSQLIEAIQDKQGAGGTSGPHAPAAPTAPAAPAAAPAAPADAPAAPADATAAPAATVGARNGTARAARSTSTRRAAANGAKAGALVADDATTVAAGVEQANGPAIVAPPAHDIGAPDDEDAASERPERADRGRERFLEREARRQERQAQQGPDSEPGPADRGDQDRAVADRSQSQDRWSQDRVDRQPTQDRVDRQPTQDRVDRQPTQDRVDRQGGAGQVARQPERDGTGPRRDEEDEAGGRRGRFRERGRNRNRNARGVDRFVGDIEPVLSDDDVLVPIGGILDILDNYGFVRTSGYLTGPNDVYVSLQQVRTYGLRRGDAVTGAVRQQREGERKDKYNALVRLDSVNGLDVEEAKKRPEFTKLTPLYPQDRLRLETESSVLTTRVIDLVMPVGKGQRALIVSPPKAGKTMVMQAIANAIATNNPECHLMVVLVDERPEEVTDMQRSVKGEVIASTFDRPPQDHITVAELSIERAKRLVELGHDVVVLLDSITRLGRAYNLGAPASGRILTGGVDSAALYPPKRFLGAARNIENGGSLTIFATALVETGSAMDTVIFEEFKGTGNAELKLDRGLANKRIFPAIDVDASSTRKEEILLAPDELRIVLQLRRVLHALDASSSLELLLDKMKSTRTNIEFLMQIQKTTANQDER